MTDAQEVKVITVGGEANAKVFLKALVPSDAPLPDKEENEISFLGIGYESFFHFGVIDWMTKNSITPKSFSKVYATCGGCIPAILWLCDVGFEKFSEWIKTPQKKSIQATCENLKNLLNSVLPQNAHEIASGKFHVWVSKYIPESEEGKGDVDFERLFISSFATRDQLLDFIEASCYVPSVTKPTVSLIKIGEHSYQFSGTDNMFPNQGHNVFQVSSSPAIPAFSGGLCLQFYDVECPFDIPSQEKSLPLVKKGYLACEENNSLINLFLKRTPQEEPRKDSEKGEGTDSPREGTSATE
jgi:hypothetical protein